MATTSKQWPQSVAKNSNALDLDKGVFALDSPAAIAASLKHSAEQSKRRKAEPFQSAMSMLGFYINRAGKSLPRSRLRILEKAKGELRKLHGKE